MKRNTVSCFQKPRIYVGTFRKYSTGSIAGGWLELTNHTDGASFQHACRELHSDEHDPEFMFQDWEAVPSSFISESHLDQQIWEWLALDEEDRELLAVYQDRFADRSATIDDARDHFLGRHENKTAWAEEYLREAGILARIPEELRRFFDVEQYAREAELGGDVSFIDRDGEVWVFLG